MTPERLADWEALCAFLEAQPYNAAYRPNCQGAYLLGKPYPARRTIEVDDLDRPYTIAGRSGYRKKTVPNPDYPAEQKRAQQWRQIVKERRQLGLVFWSTGYGWRLRKDYREILDRRRAALASVTTPEGLRDADADGR